MITTHIAPSQRWQDYGIYALYLTCFFCLLSSSMIALFSTIMLVCWLASGTYKNIPGIIKENPITAVGIIFCCLLLAGVFYSPAPLFYSLSFFKKYRLLLFIPIVMSLTKGRDNVPRNIVNAFLLGYLVVLVNAYLVHFHLFEAHVMLLKRSGGGFLAIFAYLVFQRALQDKLHRWLWAVFFLVQCYDFFFILDTRTGWLIFIGLAMLFVMQHFPLKKQVVFLGLMVCLAVGIFYTSQSVQQRVQLTIDNLRTYHPEEKNARSSLGLRLDWYQTSINLIKERPFLGYGTGSYEVASKTITEGTATEPTGDPHNEFLLTTVQLGLVGLTVLLLFLVTPVIRSHRLLLLKEREQAYALQATVLFLVIGSFFNSWLLTMIPSHIFAFLIVAFYPVRTSLEQIHLS